MFFEDQIPEEYRERLLSVASSDDWTFSVLAKLGKLNPTEDFREKNLRGLDLRGSDLRGFDFTGSDLSNCIFDQTTIYDETTIFPKKRADWVEIEVTPIVEKMSQILTAASSTKRRKLLVNLIDEYKSPAHINQFLMKAMGSADGVEAFFDYCNVMISPLPHESKRQIRLKLASLLKKRAKQKKRNRTISGRTAIQLGIVQRFLEETSNGALKTALWHIESNKEPISLEALITFLEGHGDLLTEL